MYKSIKYYVSQHTSRTVLLHKEGCQYLPRPDSRTFIGSCYTPAQALTVSLMQYSNIHYCPHCLSDVTHAKVAPVNPPPLIPLCGAKKPPKKPKEKQLKAVRHFPV
jgi:hypothetical protein